MSPPQEHVFVSDEMLRAGKAVLFGLLEGSSPEFVVDQIYRAMLRAKDDPSAGSLYERIYAGADASEVKMR